jgi:polysaccharide deacetylase family protein (PEP-CTERM system associated)
MKPQSNKPLNALTIDVEDWVQSVYDVDAPLTSCFIRNTHAVLELLARHDTHATFFVLGLAAEKSPELVRAIHAAGHEVQSHGFGHRLIRMQTPAQFRDDVRRSKLLLEDIIGQPITGYRAPAFSITRRTLWALDELADAGFEYDSSIFPVRMRRYGIGGLPAIPYRLRTPKGNELTEIPVCSIRVGPFHLPAGGGGYLRTAPSWYTRRAIARMNQNGHPAVLYMHPYELAPREFVELSNAIPWRTRIQQGFGRKTVAAKLKQLLTEFSFGTIRELLAPCLLAKPAAYIGEVSRHVSVFNPLASPVA